MQKLTNRMHIYTRATTKSASRPYAASTAERTSIHVCNVFALTFFFDRLMGIQQYFRILHAKTNLNFSNVPTFFLGGSLHPYRTLCNLVTKMSHAGIIVVLFATLVALLVVSAQLSYSPDNTRSGRENTQYLVPVSSWTMDLEDGEWYENDGENHPFNGDDDGKYVSKFSNHPDSPDFKGPRA